MVAMLSHKVTLRSHCGHMRLHYGYLELQMRPQPPSGMTAQPSHAATLVALPACNTRGNNVHIVSKPKLGTCCGACQSSSGALLRSGVIVTMTIASAVTWYSIVNGKWQWHQHSSAEDGDLSCEAALQNLYLDALVHLIRSCMLKTVTLRL